MKLDCRDQRWLKHTVSEVKVKTTMFQINGRKASGEDGIPRIFFQKYWHLLGEALTKFAFEAFRTGSFSPELNKTIINLIPK